MSERKQLRSTIRMVAFTALTGLWGSAVIQGCGGPGDELCDIQCECSKCSDRFRDECSINRAAEADRASAYGCDAEYDEYIQCAIEDNDCDNQNFSIDDSCNDEQQDLDECIADASDLTGSSGVGPSSGSGQSGSGQTGSGSTGSGQTTGSGGGTLNCSCTCDCAQIGEVPFDLPTCDPNQVPCDCGSLCEAVCVETGLNGFSGACQ